jgi:epoxyqueuosine reductase
MNQMEFLELVRKVIPVNVSIGVAWIDACEDGYRLDFEPTFALVLMLPYKLYTGVVSKDYGRLASIGCLEDYHVTIEALLDRVSALLIERTKMPTLKKAYFIDKHGNDDRRIAYRTGNLFYGKNNLLIHPDYGSAFTIGYGLWDLKDFIEVERLNPQVGGCGTCRRCIDACPHDALSEVHGFELTKCISWINQKSGELSEDESNKMSNWLYGCDLCQLACPYNTNQIEDAPCGISLDELMRSSNKMIKHTYGNRSFAYLGGGRLRRNAELIKTRDTERNL